MTMIAGFQIEGTPFLIGDLVTSLNDSVTGELRRHDAKKKVVIISSNCAVAWTGTAFQAGKIGAIARHFNGAAWEIWIEIWSDVQSRWPTQGS